MNTSEAKFNELWEMFIRSGNCTKAEALKWFNHGVIHAQSNNQDNYEKLLKCIEYFAYGLDHQVARDCLNELEEK